MQELPSRSGEDYARILRESLEAIAKQLERDLSTAAQENSYITDPTAIVLRSAASELDRCNISPRISNDSIDRLAWFVGGDLEKIQLLQRLINETDLVARIKEDGVYGKETMEAEQLLVNVIKEDLEGFLKNRAAVAAVTEMMSLDLEIRTLIAFPHTLISHKELCADLSRTFFESRRSVQRIIWKLGAELYLRPRGYDVAALLLEHSLDTSPTSLHFPEGHWVTRKFIQSNAFQAAFLGLQDKIRRKSDLFSFSGWFDLNFGQTGDRDLHYGIGKCRVYYSCHRLSSAAEIDFSAKDEYNFDELRSFEGSKDTFIVFSGDIGTYANDFGLVSQADGVISPYSISISFSQTLPL